MPTPTNVYNQVKAIFDRAGVPEYVWVPIAWAESGLNPKAKNENPPTEASYGLFQINTLGGQGVGLTADQLYDPVFNAEIAARAIAPAYNQVKDAFPPELTAAQVAIRSGHPGNVSLDDPRVKNIQAIATRFVKGFAQNVAIIDSGNYAGPLGNNNLAPAAVPSDASAIPGFASLQSIGDAAKQLTDRFDQIGAPGVLLGVMGVVLIAIALAALFAESNLSRVVSAEVAA